MCVMSVCLSVSLIYIHTYIYIYTYISGPYIHNTYIYIYQARRNEKNSGGAGHLLKNVGQLGLEDLSIEMA